MGTTYRWMLVRTGGDEGDIPEALNDVRFRSFGTFGGWFVAELAVPPKSTDRGPRPALNWDFDTFEQLVGSAGAAALGILVIDSDFACLLAVTEAGDHVPFVTDPELARDDRDGVEALARCEATYGTGYARERSLRDLADWSSGAPSPCTAQELAELFDADDDYAEQTIHRFLRRLGLPSPPDAPPRFHIDDLGGEYGNPWPGIDNTSVEYRTGYGLDFYGIWDRAGGPPIERFPRTPEGEVAAKVRRRAMLFPPDPKYLDAVLMYDFRGSPRTKHRPPPRPRYVMGEGTEFYGIWVRSSGGAPIETFAKDRSGRETAQRRLIELLMGSRRFRRFAAREGSASQPDPAE